MLRKSLICLTLILCLLGGSLVISAETPIKLVVDGREITGLAMPPVIYQNRMLVPAKEVFENLGATVEWHPEARAVYITYENQLLVMTLDETTAYLNGVARTMEVAPQIINNKTMIPLRFPADYFGLDVNWDPDQRTAYISTPEPEPAVSERPIIPIPEYAGTAVSDNSVQALPTDLLAKDVSDGDISSASHAETTIVTLLTPQETLMPAYIVVASSPMSEVRKFLLADNRLVVDIYNAVCGIWGPFYRDNSCPISDVRASQFMDTPKVTRVVFDVVGPAEYSITLSPDRTTLIISFAPHGQVGSTPTEPPVDSTEPPIDPTQPPVDSTEPPVDPTQPPIDSTEPPVDPTQPPVENPGVNLITDVTFSTDGIRDSFTITGSYLPVIKVYPLAEPSRVGIYIANAEMGAIGGQVLNGLYARSMTLWQQDGFGYIEVLTNETPSFDIVYGLNTVTVYFTPTTYQNIEYDRQNQVLIIPKSSGLLMDINAIKQTDDYTHFQYIFSLPVNAEAVLGYGEYFIQDGYIQSIIIARDAEGMTQIVINEARVLAFTVYENADNYFIKAHLPKDLYPRIVVIDPGHGGTDPGTIKYGRQEKDINLQIALKVMQLFEYDPNIKAYATRLTDKTFVREDRPPYANAVGDMFISIHLNATETNPIPSGTEVWYWPHANDQALGLACQELAEIMQAQLVSALGSIDRGVKSDELIVLKGTNMPAVLCEVGFLSNPTEGYNLSTEEYQWSAALAIYRGICEAFETYTPAR